MVGYTGHERVCYRHRSVEQEFRLHVRLGDHDTRVRTQERLDGLQATHVHIGVHAAKLMQDEVANRVAFHQRVLVTREHGGVLRVTLADQAFAIAIRPEIVLPVRVVFNP